MKKVDKQNESDKDAFIKTISKIPNYGLAEYDSDSYYPCHNGDSCCDNDYCRCRQITNARVTSINKQEIINFLVSKVKDPYNIYCVDRLSRTSDILDKNSWEVNVGGGYYGEEVYGVQPNAKVIEDLQSLIESYFNKSDIKKIKDLLIHEYGFLLPILENTKKVSIVKVATSDVKIPNLDYSRKVNQKIVNSYENYNLPRAICYKSDDSNWKDKNTTEYRLIDGYHRIMSALKFDKKKIDIIVLE